MTWVINIINIKDELFWKKCETTGDASNLKLHFKSRQKAEISIEVI